MIYVHQHHIIKYLLFGKIKYITSINRLIPSNFPDKILDIPFHISKPSHINSSSQTLNCHNIILLYGPLKGLYSLFVCFFILSSIYHMKPTSPPLIYHPHYHLTIPPHLTITSTIWSSITSLLLTFINHLLPSHQPSHHLIFSYLAFINHINLNHHHLTLINHNIISPSTTSSSAISSHHHYFPTAISCKTSDLCQ